ncbi:MAG: hypothetical protein LLG13_12995 [Bacteroidales bacterium]|nr:hypothetical protein [Bacteroidales bacterium]
MKMIRMKYKILLAGILVIMFSCQKMEYTKEYSWSYPLSGEWALQIEYGGSVDAGPYFIKVYNTSFGQDSVWIDDNGNIWPFKAKAKADMKTLTFSTTDYTSMPGTNYEDIVTIKNGKVIQKDSIYFETEFGSDPGTIYKMYGHRASSYEEYNEPH